MIKNKGFEILLASPPDYQNLVAEIYYDGKFVVLVSQERGGNLFDLEIPGSNLVDGELARKVDLVGFEKVLEEAKQRLKK